MRTKIVLHCGVACAMVVFVCFVVLFGAAGAVADTTELSVASLWLALGSHRPSP
jgi:hypothetical protein